MRARIFVILLISGFLSHSGQAEEKPSEASCRALYLKRISALAAQQDEPASPGIRARKKELESEPTIKAAVAHCRANLTARSVQCGLDPESCEEAAPEKTEPDTQPLPGKDNTSDPAANPPATADECKKVYEHLLAIYATDELKTKPGGEDLLKNWRSPVARQSFQARCEKVFHKQDSECILSSDDPDIARACLLVIPE